MTDIRPSPSARVLERPGLGRAAPQTQGFFSLQGPSAAV